ncbi:hypothetical protein TcYC6_0120310 [Trypanosoma cruzi]|nr:hypothetical protein TcYC6_0120310 [Trypanosoma cruzi]
MSTLGGTGNTTLHSFEKHIDRSVPWSKDFVLQVLARDFLCAQNGGKIERGHAVCVTTPGAVCLQGNYNDLTRAKDALAGCQRNITGLLSELESTIDEYADQSQKVAECEETFWSNVKLAELESKALLHLSRRIRFVAGSH